MIIIDIETSGIDPDKHGVLSVGAIEFENPDNQFYTESYLSPDLDYEEETAAVHGFNLEQVRDETRESPYILIKSLVDWMQKISDRTPAGVHIASFDLQFLQRLAHREKINWPLGKRSVDLHTLVYGHVQRNQPDLYQPINQRSNINSNFIQRYCGITEVPFPHNALTDAKWEAECFSRLLSGKKLLPEFKNQEIPDYLKN